MSEENKTEQKQAVQSEAAKLDTTSNKAGSSGHKLLLYTCIVIVSLLLLGGAFAAGRHTQRTSMLTVHNYGNTELSRNSTRGQGSFSRDIAQDGSTRSRSTTRVAGVATAVNGNTITVAGDGTTTKVTVSSNTMYTGSSEPAKVNDTIIAFGAKDSSDTLIASNVRLTRE